MGWGTDDSDGARRRGGRNHGKLLVTREYTRRAQPDTRQRKSGRPNRNIKTRGSRRRGEEVVEI